MTHRQPAAFGSPVFRICGPAPPAHSPCLPSTRSRFVRRDPPDLVQHQLSRLIPCTTNRPARSPTTARRARPLAVRAASFARRVGSKPGQALRPRRRPPLWWLVVRVDWSGPLHLQPSHASIAGHSTNFACNSLVTISNREFAALELQRFLTWLNLRPIELHATFGGGLAVRRRPPRW